jgi:phosphoribosylaminoimidazole (AIR) synthetase
MSDTEAIQDVNIELVDEMSKMLYEASKLTHENRPGFLVELHESFSGFRAIPGSVLKDVDNLYLNLGLDGVGTKVEVSERLDDHSVVAHDLFAMVCDDAVVRGAEPVAIGSILDVKHLGDPGVLVSIEHARNAVR